MRADESAWRQAFAAMPGVDSGVAERLGVAFVSRQEFEAKRGSAWLWWPADRSQPMQRCDYEGRAAPDWAMLLVVSETVPAALAAEGGACIGSLVRRGEMRPFLLHQADALEAAGLSDFIESLGLAFPRH